MKASEIKRGIVVEYDTRIHQVREVQKSAPQGRGGNATYRIILYSVPGGHKLDISLRAEDELREVDLIRRPASFSYKDGAVYVFFDDEDYSPYRFDPETLGDAAGYITEGLAGCTVQLIDDSPVALQLPATVALEVAETAPELKGGTATKRPKPARLATGIEVMVPEYISTGERVLINTSTGEFSSRA